MSDDLRETTNIDFCECVYCGFWFHGRDACNGDMDASLVRCPKCDRAMNVYVSCEFTCSELETEDEDD